VSGQVGPLRLLEKGKLLMEERSYEDALETFRTLERQDGTLSPIVWQGRALKRLGRLREAIQVLDDGLRLRGASDDSFRRAVTLWNLACYRTLLNASSMTPETVRSIVAVLDEAIQNAPDFCDGLSEQALDRDLASLVGNPIFDHWRGAILDTMR
jgi:tetratricopeptide (TPR) repeat protein